MARIDKVVQLVRAPAGQALSGVLGVTVNAGGSVVPAATGAKGVVCIPGTIATGRPVGILVRGEIVEFGGLAGSVYYSGAAGALGTASAGGQLVGFTVEADRLIVTM